MATSKFRAQAMTAAAITASRKPGHVGRHLRKPTITASAKPPIPIASQFTVARQGAQLRHESGWLARQVEPEQLLQLAGQDDDRDAGGEADRDGKGDVLDVCAKPEKTGPDQDQARQKGGEHEPVITVPFDNGRNEHDESARRSADLEAAAAKDRDKEPADDGREQTTLRADPGGDGNGHG